MSDYEIRIATGIITNSDYSFQKNYSKKIFFTFFIDLQINSINLEKIQEYRLWWNAVFQRFLSGMSLCVWVHSSLRIQQIP